MKKNAECKVDNHFLSRQSESKVDGTKCNLGEWERRGEREQNEADYSLGGRGMNGTNWRKRTRMRERVKIPLTSGKGNTNDTLRNAEASIFKHLLYVDSAI